MYSVVSKNFTNVQGYNKRKWMDIWVNKIHNYIYSQWEKSLSYIYSKSIDVVNRLIRKIYLFIQNIIHGTIDFYLCFSHIRGCSNHKVQRPCRNSKQLVLVSEMIKLSLKKRSINSRLIHR